jgi:hypothetical protein
LDNEIKTIHTKEENCLDAAVNAGKSKWTSSGKKKAINDATIVCTGAKEARETQLITDAQKIRNNTQQGGANIISHEKYLKYKQKYINLKMPTY